MMTVDLVGVFVSLVISATLAWVMVKEAEMEGAMFFFLAFIIRMILTLFYSVIAR